MLLLIQHETELTYTERISETVMELRMSPRTDEHQSLHGLRIDVGPIAPLYEHVDWLGNRVHQFSVVPFHERLVICSQSAVETTPTHPVSLGELNEGIPFESVSYQHADFLRFGGLVVSDPRLKALAEKLGIVRAETVGAVLERIASGLRDHIEYRKGVTTSSATLSHALDEKAGVCQDLAHIAIGLLRAKKIPARYVSGYYFSGHGPPELETHAWCEAFCPSIGWVPLDPTHRCVASSGHVAIAVGRDFSDVPPNRGVYRGKAEEKISVRVAISEIDALPGGLVPPKAVQFRTSGSEAPRPHREQLDYQQEQQQQQ